MPLKGDAKEVMKSMKDQYGAEEGERVFYATANTQNRKPETWEKKAFHPSSIVRSLSRHPGMTGAALGGLVGAVRGDDMGDSVRQGLVGAGIGAGVGAGAGMAGRMLKRDPHRGLPQVQNTPASDPNALPKVAEAISGGLADSAHGKAKLRELATKNPGRYGAQLRKGTKVELEHTNDREAARDIAEDHIVEDGQYYTKLEKMEKKSVFVPAQVK